MKASRPPPVRKAPLPVPLSTLPRLTEAAQLDVALHDLGHAIESKNLPYLQRNKAALPQLRKQWRAAEQPATIDQIRTAVLALATTMPTASNIAMGVLTEKLCDHVAELNPSAFVLARACHAHRANAEFLSVHRLVAEIRRAERRTGDYRELLDRDFAEEIKCIEESYENQRVTDKQRKQENRKLIAALRRDWGEEIPDGFLTGGLREVAGE